MYFGNVQSLHPKMNELQCLAKTFKYDIIGINESWLNLRNKHVPAEIALDGFTTFAVDKPTTTGRGGGSVLYVRDHLKPVLKIARSTEKWEIISATIQNANRVMIRVILIYRNGSITAEEDEQFYRFLEEEIAEQEAVIVGDFNLPMINWANHSSGRPGSRLLDLIRDHHMTQHVLQPTRRNNILDLVITTDDRLVINVDIKEKLGDHNMLEFQLKAGRVNSQPQHKTVYNFREADFNSLRERLQRDDELNNMQHDDANHLYNTFTSRLHEHTRRCIPTHRIRTRKQPSWWKLDIKHSIKRRNLAHKRAKSSNNPNNRREHVEACRLVKRTIRAAKRQKEASIARFSKTNPKAFFSYINEHRIIKDSIGPLKDSDDVLCTGERSIANVLNKYFNSVYTDENTNYIPDLPNYQGEILENIQFTVSEIKTRLDKLNIYKSMGPDEVHPRVLKNCSSVISVILEKIYTKSMDTGIVPEDWRSANITAIFKKGNRQITSNYRPISLTSVVCKTFERIVRDRLVDHLESNNLLLNSQHGFRRRRSCLTNLIDFFEGVTNCFDQTKAVDIIYLDFQKAFDKVPHRRLLAKLDAHGIRGNLLRWLQAWLTNRRQRVVVKNTKSDWSPVASGVPQGSVLGPVLFLIYVNDMDAGVLSRISKFADDTKLYHKVCTDEDKREIQQDLERLVSWANEWQMSFNVSKCAVLQIGNNNPKNVYHMNDTIVKAAASQKDLGVTINNDLKWSKQIENSVNKANRMLGLITRNFKFRSKNIVLTLYKSLVRPHLEYAVQFWSPHQLGDIAKLERVQRRVTKLIPELRQMPYDRRLEELGLTTLEQRRLRSRLIETYKYLHGFVDVSYDTIFERDQNGRRGHDWKLIVKRAESTTRLKFFPLTIVQHWNNLPPHVVSAESVDSFKNRLDKHLSDRIT